MALKYRVEHLFAHNGRTYTNQPQDLEDIKKLPRSYRDHQIKLGHLTEWDDKQGDQPPADKE